MALKVQENSSQAIIENGFISLFMGKFVSDRSQLQCFLLLLPPTQGFPLYPDHPVIIPAQLTPDQFFEGQKTAVNSSCLKLKALSIKAFEITPKTELSPSQRRTLRR
jgi:hypothetical protein